MNNAPSVDFPVGRSRFEAFTIAAVLLLGGAATAAWTLQAPAGDPGPWWAAALLAVAALIAVLAWWRAPAGHLVWNGAQWRWEEATAGGQGDRVGRRKTASGNRYPQAQQPTLSSRGVQQRGDPVAHAASTTAELSCSRDSVIHTQC